MRPVLLFPFMVLSSAGHASLHGMTVMLKWIWKNWRIHGYPWSLFYETNQSPSYEFILVCPTVAIITFGSVAFHLITLLPKTLINMTQDRPHRQAACSCRAFNDRA